MNFLSNMDKRQRMFLACFIVLIAIVLAVLIVVTVSKSKKNDVIEYHSKYANSDYLTNVTDENSDIRISSLEETEEVTIEVENETIIVERKNTARNGETVVAMNDNNEVTVKTFYKENGYFRLQPENDTMEPIILKKCTILGKVVGLYRKF